jgi:hypothetical protein
MAIRANNIVIRGEVIEPVKPRIVEESLAAIRHKAEQAPPSKVNDPVESLITYKQSAFMTDILQSSKE